MWTVGGLRSQDTYNKELGKDHPLSLYPGGGRLTLLVAVDADNLTERHNQSIVPENAGKEPEWCHQTQANPAILPSFLSSPDTPTPALKAG